jgi:hypothetical protein
MWKPRLASFALCALSLCVIWQATHLELAYNLTLIVGPIVGFAVVGFFCGFSGIIASFLATPSGDTYFVPADNVLIRFLARRKIIDLSRNMGFCEYSVCVGGVVLLALFLLFLMGLISYGLSVKPEVVIWGVSMFIGLVGCIFGMQLLVKKFPKIILPLLILPFLFVAFRVYTSPPGLTDATDALVTIFLSIGIMCILVFMRHLLTKTRIYVRFCPQSSKTESIN